jgi:putative PIN family toxin of toxin-antitoxin system
MDILIDTNILISAFAFPGKSVNTFLTTACYKYNVLICSYSLIELESVLERKFPHLVGKVDEFLIKYKFIQVLTPAEPIIKEVLNGVFLRDEKDNPILASAIFADADILVTGDKDFAGLSVARPLIMTINEFNEKYL